ncbi:predicted protein [Chaetomium globosum CBS 148.51]|uniref:Uncharacterized protein n=1 Tax=Chaetomium globosum (strain ATCC 6205 / CBS 148.51 / DSM 1962 / NBRC 6347 / NRRL 1970) TaxID=306901 RepID=Q2GRQ7_CHAGB|nr:uncharacterized protein CHGG_09347 [Chaetomium globosum CBS 148.51]EAQ85333.1 predicted protein [Chaetomium globosum CBS 148.51]
MQPAPALSQPWKEWYKPSNGPLGERMVIPYMAAGNGGGSGALPRAPAKPQPVPKEDKE